MKYALALVLILALVLPNIETFPKKDHGKNGGRDGGGRDGRRDGGHHDRRGRCQPSEIFTCIQKYIENNVTVSAAFIDALNSASLSQYIVDGKLNYTGLNQNLFTALPALTDFLNTYIVTAYNSKIENTITTALTVIDGLRNDATNQTVFGGLLVYKKFFDYVSGTLPTLNVDYTLVQGNSKSARLLNFHIDDQSRERIIEGTTIELFREIRDKLKNKKKKTLNIYDFFL